ncbi:hypothetical protein H0H93_010983, partial [Arthromyces matolae]
TESEVEMKKTAMREWISKISPIPLSLIPQNSRQANRVKMVSERREKLLQFAKGMDNDEMDLQAFQLEILLFQWKIFKDLPKDEGTHHLALRLMMEALKIFLYPVYRGDKPPETIGVMITIHFRQPPKDTNLGWTAPPGIST